VGTVMLVYGGIGTNDEVLDDFYALNLSILTTQSLPFSSLSLGCFV
jgi:hypothetical protein